MVYLLLAWILIVMLLVTVYRHHLSANWREPVLRVPVLIFESDDWGAGPRDQAEALRRLAQILGDTRDVAGKPATMTLGVVLAIVDRAAWRDSKQYQAHTLAASENAEIVEAIQQGVSARVFAPQLHGMEHYWPAALVNSAVSDDRVQRWLSDDGVVTESLPAALQSRWIDASILPARSLSLNQIRLAVAAEVQLFQSLFHDRPRVAVPNTFVWNDDVESAWSEEGVRYVVTPGTRYEARGVDGKLVSSGRKIANGDISPHGIYYVVRDVYLEPAHGHQPRQLLEGLAERTRLGRPCLVETHRFNYLGGCADNSFNVLRQSLEMAVRDFPNVRFMSTADLADAIVERSDTLVEVRLSRRVRVWIARVLSQPRFRKLAWATGFAPLLLGSQIFAGLIGGSRRGHA